MDKGLTYGLKEAQRPSEFLYDPGLFALEGPYGSALKALDDLISRKGPVPSVDSWRLKLRVIHECEESKRWATMTAVHHDYPTAQVGRADSKVTTFASALKAVRLLKQADCEEAFFFRHAFSRALEAQVSAPEPLRVWVPNQNEDAGGTLIEADARTKAHIEHQLIWRIALFGAGEFLSTLEAELGKAKHDARPWRKVGALRVNPGLSRKQVAKLDVGVLGLSGRLAYVFREWTAGRGVTPYWPGLEMPSDGSPCWKVVAEFVNAALRPPKEQGEEDVRKRRVDFARDRSVRLDPWPQKAISEAQTRANKIVADRQP